MANKAAPMGAFERVFSLSDRELLLAACRTAHINVKNEQWIESRVLVRWPGEELDHWFDPLQDASDAMDLVIKIGMQFAVDGDGPMARCWSSDPWTRLKSADPNVDMDQARDQACRVIVMAAAVQSIGDE